MNAREFQEQLQDAFQFIEDHNLHPQEVWIPNAHAKRVIEGIKNFALQTPEEREKARIDSFWSENYR